MLLSINSRLPSQESHGEFGEMARELRNPTATIITSLEYGHSEELMAFFVKRTQAAMEKFWNPRVFPPCWRLFIRIITPLCTVRGPALPMRSRQQKPAWKWMILCVQFTQGTIKTCHQRNIELPGAANWSLSYLELGSCQLVVILSILIRIHPMYKHISTAKQLGYQGLVSMGLWVISVTKHC